MSSLPHTRDLFASQSNDQPAARPGLIGRFSPYAWLWLALSVISGMLSSGHWVVPILAWFGPVFSLLFLTTRPDWIGKMSLLAAGYFVFVFTQRGIIPIADHELAVAGLLGAFLGFSPYWIYRRLSERFASYWVTLTFPAMIVAIEFLLAQGPFGTWGSVATTQYRNSAIIQVLSFTGIAGLVFLIHWFAASVAWIWGASADHGRRRWPIMTTTAVMLLIAIGGELRLTFQGDTRDQVKVAGIVINESAFQQEATRDIIKSIRSGQPTDERITRAFLESLDKRKSELFARSAAAANMGAKVVYWSEACLAVRPDDEPAIIDSGKAFAKTHNVYFGMTLATMCYTDADDFIENKIVLAHPDGRTTNVYVKSIIPPGEPSVAGSGDVPSIQSSFGVISNVICFDTDFSKLMRQPGRGGARIVIAPSNDWPAAAEPHLAVSSLRAVENNYSLVRVTSNGISAVIDPFGRLNFQSNSIGNDSPDFVVDVPLGSGQTPYALLGDWLAIASCCVALISVVFAILPSKQGKGSTIPAHKNSSP